MCIEQSKIALILFDDHAFRRSQAGNQVLRPVQEKGEPGWARPLRLVWNYWLASQKRMSMAAVSARVAPALGASVPLPLPVIRPVSIAHCIAVTA